MSRYRLPRPARADLKEAVRYIARDHIRQGLRRFSHGNYAIYYEVAPECVRFVRILHGARDAEAIFAEEDQ